MSQLKEDDDSSEEESAKTFDVIAEDDAGWTFTNASIQRKYCQKPIDSLTYPWRL